MHSHFYFIPIIIVVGAIFLYIMFRRNRRENSPDRSAPTDPQHLERDDDPARRQAINEGPNPRKKPQSG